MVGRKLTSRYSGNLYRLVKVQISLFPDARRRFDDRWNHFAVADAANVESTEEIMGQKPHNLFRGPFRDSD
jgi:hypothetical protein